LLINALQEKLAKIKDIPTPKVKFSELKGKLPFPVEGKIISSFGEHKHPKFNVKVFNQGITILPKKNEVISVAEGVVIYANAFSGYKQIVIIDHGEGYCTVYGNLSEVIISQGKFVEKGSIIGFLDGDNLYFEIRKDGIPIDPVPWLE
jgi:septal ring factor EnvC (AmiA/AmiB activator)